MASSLSEEEFHRMQLQLLELRTANYELDGKCKKQERELTTLKESFEYTDKELQKAQKAISKSKKARDVEALVQETENLQRKLQSQEEEFRLQNETLMQELSLLVSTNEELEKGVKLRKEEQGGNNSLSKSPSTSHLEDEIRRLQAQNTALQRNLTEYQEKHERRQRRSESETVEADVTDSADVSEPTDTQNDTETEDGEEAKPDIEVSDAETLERLEKTVDELKLKLDTELEEKRMLKNDLAEKETKYSSEITELQSELEKASEKLKKKQESFIHLQEEKEKLYEESNKKLEELQGSKDRDHKYYNDQVAKLQTEIQKYKKEQDEMRSSSGQTVKELETKLASMQQQVDAASIVGSQHLQEQARKFQSQITELQNQILTLTQQKDDLSAQLTENQKASQGSMDQLLAIQQERDQQMHLVQEANKVAEKRKTLLDELAINYQKDCDKNREQMLSMENSYEAELKAIRHKVDEEKKRIAELEKHKPVIEELHTKVTSLEESKGWLERRLAETEGSLDETLDENKATIALMTSDFETEIESMKESHLKEVTDLKSSYDTQIQELKEREESQLKRIHGLELEVKTLKQEIKDSLGDKKIHEKKGKSVLKDLKKQLHAERKRTEKLQERLQEVLSESGHNRSMEDLFHSPDRVNDSWREDRSSISSWSAGASGAGTFTSFNSGLSISPTSPTQEEPTLTNHSVENETQELLNRVGSLQQEKWDLEEKVRHLETSTAAMADDLLEKSKIIQHYVMESRTDARSQHIVHDDKITLKKVLDMVNSKEDQNLRDMNKKLQNMLEETLTKNMHLQQNLEMLSEEIVQLKRISQQATSSEPSGPPPSTSEQDARSVKPERPLEDGKSAVS